MTENIYEPPKSEVLSREAGNVFGHKKYVIHEKDMDWPSRCYKCADASDNLKKVTLFHVNPWIYLTIFIMPLITIILALIFRRKFKVEIPICDTHLKKRKRFILLQWIFVFLSVVGILLGSVASNEILLPISIFLILVVVIMAIAGRLVNIAKYKKGNLWITGAGKKFIGSLPPFEI